MLLPNGVRAGLNQVNNLLVSDFSFQSKGSPTLVVAFAGMSGIRRTLATLKQKAGIEVRPFEFVHSLQDRECDVLFLRDRYRAYYHSGVKGVGNNADQVAGFLNEFIRQRRYDLVVTLGHSMGGYASILFASKINADACIAMSPPTFLDEVNRTRYDDKRYAHEKTNFANQDPSLLGILTCDLTFLLLKIGILENDACIAFSLAIAIGSTRSMQAD